MDDQEKNLPPYEEAPYEVGYGRPPKQGQFKKGQSGNPKGRPPTKAKGDGRIDVAAVLNEPMTVKTKDGKIIEMSPFEVGLRKLAQQALQKKVANILTFLKICEDCGLMKAEPDSGGGVMTVPNGMSVDDWIRSQNDPTFKPVTKEYDALVKKHLPDKYREYQIRKAVKEQLAKEKAEDERKAKRLLSKRSGGQNKKAIIRKIAMERHRVNQDGKVRNLTTVELVLLTLRNMAVDGNSRALREYLKIDERATPQDPPARGALLVPEDQDDLEFTAEQMEENLHRKPPPGVRHEYGYLEDDEEEPDDKGK